MRMLCILAPFKILQRKPVDQGHREFKRFDQNDRACHASFALAMSARGSVFKCRSTAADTALARSAESVTRWIVLQRHVRLAPEDRRDPIQLALPSAKDHGFLVALRSCRCRPCQTPGAWQPPRKRTGADDLRQVQLFSCCHKRGRRRLARRRSLDFLSRQQDLRAAGQAG